MADRDRSRSPDPQGPPGGAPDQQNGGGAAPPADNGGGGGGGGGGADAEGVKLYVGNLDYGTPWVEFLFSSTLSSLILSLILLLYSIYYLLSISHGRDETPRSLF
jgi:hypothetical protein